MSLKKFSIIIPTHNYADDELCSESLDAFRNHLDVCPETQYHWRPLHYVEYASRRLLSLFRIAYLTGNHEKACSLYASAFRGDWRMALGTGYLTKALRIFLWNRNAHPSH